MSRDDPKVEFSGTFTAGSMQVAGRDLTVNAPTEGRIGEVHQQMADVELIQTLLRRVPLTEDDRRATSEAVDRLQEEVAKPEPNPSAAAHALEDLTAILKAAGGLAVAGLDLVGPIGRIAVALGGAAAGVLKAIGR
jgi:hypothetical protein